jgi:16S rRNA (guanine966-N2)-methyltransferase
MRVIAGSARGRPLKAPRGTSVRPTSDRVREAMFSSLAPVVPGAVVLDLFAGTGALGIEALSRGARAAVFVERDAATAALLTQNLRATGLHEAATVVRTDASAFVARPQPAPFTLVLCDPPYDLPFEVVVDLLDTLGRNGGLAADITVVVERDKRDPSIAGDPDLRGLLAIARRRSYGDTVLLYLQRR